MKEVYQTNDGGIFKSKHDAIQHEKACPFPKRIMVYLHSNEDTNRQIGESLGLSKDAIENKLKTCLYEVEFEIEVYKDGSYTILKVNGVPHAR